MDTPQSIVLRWMEIREILAANLRRLRHGSGLSQEELAHRADVDRTYISALERCVYAASIDVLDRIAQVLDVETAELLRQPMTVSPRRKSRAASIARKL